MEPGRSLLARTGRAASRRELAGSVPAGNAGRATPGRQKQVPHCLTAAIRRFRSLRGFERNRDVNSQEETKETVCLRHSQ